jgi:hypothetical protein
MDQDKAEGLRTDDPASDEVDKLVQAAAVSGIALLDECFDYRAGLADVFRRARRAVTPRSRPLGYHLGRERLHAPMRPR